MKQFFYYIINCEWPENKELQDKAKKVEKGDEAEQIIHEFEKIIKSKKKNMLWLAYQQGKVFKKLKENLK